MTVNCLFAH